MLNLSIPDYGGELYGVIGKSLSSVQQSRALLEKAAEYEIPEHLVEGAIVSPQTGCWVSGRYRNHAAYTTGGDDSQTLLHRWMADHFSSGELSDNPSLQADHLCRNRGCFCPLHVENVTQAENNLRMQSALEMERHLRAGQVFSGLGDDWLARLVRGEVAGRIVSKDGVYEFDVASGTAVFLGQDMTLEILAPPGKRSQRPPRPAPAGWVSLFED